MKICIATASIDKSDGGPSRSVPMLAKGLAEIGVNTTLLVVETNDMNFHILENTNVRVMVLPRHYKTSEVGSLIKAEKFDLIHLQNLWHPFYHIVAKKARALNIPYIMTPRGCLEPWCLQQKKLKKMLAMTFYQKRDLQKASCILATANLEAKHIRNLGIEGPIAIIPNGIDVSEYQCRPTSTKNTKKQILFLSRIHNKKGIEFLINAWELLKTRYPDWNVVIAGNGEESYIQQLEELIIEKKLQNCVEIIPPVFGKEKYKIYCESSLFVLPSYSENFGMVIAEAMSCGVPVITTMGTPWQQLNEKQLGWCIELSLDNLIATLKTAVESGRDSLFEMGQRGSQYIYNTFQYQEVAAKNKAVYQWLIYGEEKPPFVI